MNQTGNKKGTGGRVIAGTVLILLGFVLIGLDLYVDSILGKINRLEEQEMLSEEEIQQILSETDPAEEQIEFTQPETEAVPQETQGRSPVPNKPVIEEPILPIKSDETIVNILLVGQDRRINESRQRSDAMILCTINTEKKTVVLTSFLRDTYVQLPWGYGKNRLNVPYRIGGFEMLDECLEMNFGVHVDHNIEVDFTGFKRVIDAIGGVDIELTQKEADIVEGDQVVGMNHLDGGQALMYARIRKIDSDFNRTNRQRTVLLAVYEKIRHLSILEILELMDVVLPMLTTDMTDNQILSYVVDVFPILNELEILSQSVPNAMEFEYQMVDGMSVVMPNMRLIRQRLQETIGS